MSKSAAQASMERPEFFEATLNILGYPEDGEWVALALEMDLRGYGETWEEALDDLRDLVLMQLSFAYSKGHPEMAWKKAEDRFWQMLFEVKQARLFQPLAGNRAENRHAGGLAIPPPNVIAAQKNRFSLANG